MLSYQNPSGSSKTLIFETNMERSESIGVFRWKMQKIKKKIISEKKPSLEKPKKKKNNRKNFFFPPTTVKLEELSSSIRSALQLLATAAVVLVEAVRLLGAEALALSNGEDERDTQRLSWPVFMTSNGSSSRSGRLALRFISKQGPVSALTDRQLSWCQATSLNRLTPLATSFSFFFKI